MKSKIVWLPINELSEAFGKKDLIIGAFIDNDSICFVTGELKEYSLPKSIFKTSGDGITPDFSKLKVIDYGHTVAFGDYESATDFILSEGLSPLNSHNWNTLKQLCSFIHKNE